MNLHNSQCNHYQLFRDNEEKNQLQNLFNSTWLLKHLLSAAKFERPLQFHLVRDLLIYNSNFIPELLIYFALVRYLYWLLGLSSSVPSCTSTPSYLNEWVNPKFIVFFLSWGCASQVLNLSCSVKYCIPLITIIALSYILLYYVNLSWK